MKKHLFVVAHVDDEALGAGAYIYELSKKGDEVYVLFLNSYDETRYDDDRLRLHKDLDDSHRILGVTKAYRANYTDSNFHNADHREMVQFIEHIIREVQPDFMYTQHPGDINSDHYWAAQSCIEAFRLWQRGREIINPIKGLYLMEVPSSTDWGMNPAHARFEPNTFVPVSEMALLQKVKSLKVYEGVIRPHPHPRSVESIRSLAMHRGVQAGTTYAEAFQCVFRMEEV